MSWWYNKESGKYQDYTGPIGGAQEFFQGLQDDIGLSAGWVELPSNITTQAQAKAYVEKTYPNDAKPTTDTGRQILNTIPGGSALGSVTDFLEGLTTGNLWIRVAKVVVGGVLILVGVAKLTGAPSAVSKVVKKVPVIPV